MHETNTAITATTNASPPSIPEFAIIGASPAGFTLALSLLQQHPTLRPQDIHIHETHAAGHHPGGPFSLTPNALRILQKLRIGPPGEGQSSVYEHIQHLGFRQTHHIIRDEAGGFQGSLPMGNAARWGFDALRIERGEVLKVLEAEVRRVGVPVFYESSLREVAEEGDETSDGTVQFVVRRRVGNESSATTTLETRRCRRLIGADGVHSRTRAFVCGSQARTVAPVYSGNFMSAAYIPFDKLCWGTAFAQPLREREFSLSITGAHGTILLIPADKDATVMQVGRQWTGPELGREGWATLAEDKVALREMFQRDAAAWSSELPRSVLDAIRPEDIWGVWPFYALPKLERWVSGRGGRVVIVGDAAHTVVPAAAQGATQAIEDAWTLAGAFARAAMEGNEADVLRAWEKKRMARLERISQLSIQLMNVRLSPAEQAKLGPGMVFDLSGDLEERERRLDWLYGNSEQE